jgi:hypothetical protein
MTTYSRPATPAETELNTCDQCPRPCVRLRFVGKSVFYDCTDHVASQPPAPQQPLSSLESAMLNRPVLAEPNCWACGYPASENHGDQGCPAQVNGGKTPASTTTASAVSAQLKRLGFRGMRSDYQRQGIHVRGKGTVSVSVDYDSARDARDTIEAIAEALTGAGYTVTPSGGGDPIVSVTKAQQ